MSSEAAIQTVIETIDSAISARFQLSQLLDGVSEAKNQVVWAMLNCIYNNMEVKCIFALT